MLSTRYPGLRLLFVRCDYIKEADKFHEACLGIWTISGDDCGDEWDFYMNLAGLCISNNELAILLETVKPSALGQVTETGGIVETILSRYCV